MKLNTPKGTRDFSPTEIANRNFIIDRIRTAFELFGFQPVETPSFENYKTLIGKYGQEDKLIFKILNSGDFMSKVDDSHLIEKNSAKIISKISEKALRYDLTVPFARYVVQHQNEINFPFKRYQIQLVWRADKPQKGRYREFCQCDADAIACKSLWQEVEFIMLYDTVFAQLGLKDINIKINNRKILTGIAEVIGFEKSLIDFCITIDKLYKIGEEGVFKEMMSKGIKESTVEKLRPIFNISGSNIKKITSLENLLQHSEVGMEGINELKFIINSIFKLSLQSANLEIDITLARGLNYYTGTIFEVSAPKGIPVGSIGGGGRYDDLTSDFGLKGMSGVGISFGLDRIYLVLKELNLFKKVETPKVKVLFLNFDEDKIIEIMKIIAELRKNYIKSEFYPDFATSSNQQKKQWKYATNKKIEFVVPKIENEVIALKNMNSGKETNYSLTDLIIKLKK